MFHTILYNVRIVQMRAMKTTHAQTWLNEKSNNQCFVKIPYIN